RWLAGGAGITYGVRAIPKMNFIHITSCLRLKATSSCILIRKITGYSATVSLCERATTLKARLTWPRSLSLCFCQAVVLTSPRVSLFGCNERSNQPHLTGAASRPAAEPDHQ